MRVDLGQPQATLAEADLHFLRLAFTSPASKRFLHRNNKTRP
jgi:hypothetical protein